MKDGSLFCRRSRVGEGRETNRCGLGWRGPALWASGVSESRQEGAAGRSTWTPVVGVADETRRASAEGSAVSPSFVSAPAVHHRVSRWKRPAARWGGHINLRRGRTDGSENLGECQRRKENDRGSKLFRRKITLALTRAME
jgi:hypothetical protein